MTKRKPRIKYWVLCRYDSAVYSVDGLVKKFKSESAAKRFASLARFLVADQWSPVAIRHGEKEPE